MPTAANNPRPLPAPSELSRPYWEASRRRRLLYLQCADYGHSFFPPQVACVRCLSTNLQWIESSGRGTVYSYSILHREPAPGFPVPTVLAIVELNEGYTMFSNIVECDPREISIGMPVEVTFEDCSPEITLPMFRPSSGGA